MISQYYSKKKLSLCSELFYRYLEHCEFHHTNGLMRPLSSFYKREEQRYSGGRIKSPLEDDGIWEFSSYMRELIVDVFGV